MREKWPKNTQELLLLKESNQPSSVGVDSNGEGIKSSVLPLQKTQFSLSLKLIDQKWHSQCTESNIQRFLSVFGKGPRQKEPKNISVDHLKLLLACA